MLHSFAVLALGSYHGHGNRFTLVNEEEFHLKLDVFHPFNILEETFDALLHTSLQYEDAFFKNIATDISWNILKDLDKNF